jgi:hypothetical protein
MALKGIPCERDCPRRAPGCGATCPEWAEYLKRREKDYANRLQIANVSAARSDGYRRMEKLASNR